MKLAILGGTFNPPHIGHLFLAEEVYRALALDRVIFVPAHLPAHKEVAGRVPAADRLAVPSVEAIRWLLILGVLARRSVL